MKKPETLPKLNLRNLTHDEIRVMLTRIVSEWEKQESIPPTIKLLIQELTALLEVHRRILIREAACDLTKEIHRIDALRDRAYRILIRKIKNAQDEFDQNLVDASTALLPIAEKYNSSITELGLSIQTSQTKLAIGEFSAPKLAVHFTTIDITPDFDRVIQFNDQFETVWNERSALGGTEEDLPLMRVVRNNMEHYTRLLLNNSQFLFNMEHNSIDDTLYSVINEEVTKMSTALKTRKTLAEKSEESAS